MHWFTEAHESLGSHAPSRRPALRVRTRLVRVTPPVILLRGTTRRPPRGSRPGRPSTGGVGEPSSAARAGGEVSPGWSPLSRHTPGQPPRKSLPRRPRALRAAGRAGARAGPGRPARRSRARPPPPGPPGPELVSRVPLPRPARAADALASPPRRDPNSHLRRLRVPRSQSRNRAGGGGGGWPASTNQRLPPRRQPAGTKKARARRSALPGTPGSRRPPRWCPGWKPRFPGEPSRLEPASGRSIPLTVLESKKFKIKAPAALRRLRQADQQFKTCLSYVQEPYTTTPKSFNLLTWVIFLVSILSPWTVSSYQFSIMKYRAERSWRVVRTHVRFSL
ncbi:uncharacterized protein RHO17_024330 [Thomomys bottae]